MTGSKRQRERDRLERKLAREGDQRTWQEKAAEREQRGTIGLRNE
jgi:hypothetical protein